jgi:hypothetical protein
MKPDQIYESLLELAEKLDIEVSEQNFKPSGIRVTSGLCRIKGRWVYLMDKHKPVKSKVKLLAAELARHPHEDIYLVPVLRDLLAKYKPTAAEEGSHRQVPVQETPEDGSESKKFT